MVTSSQEHTCCCINPFHANIQTHLSLDTFHYTQFHSGIIPDSMDLIPTPAVKGKQKEKEEGSGITTKQTTSFVSFATVSLLSFHSNKDEKTCLTSSKHFARAR